MSLRLLAGTGTHDFAWKPCAEMLVRMHVGMMSLESIFFLRGSPQSTLFNILPEIKTFSACERCLSVIVWPKVVFYNKVSVEQIFLASDCKKEGSTVFKVHLFCTMRKVLILLATVLGVMCADPPSVASAARVATLRLKEMINERKARVCRVQDVLYVRQPRFRGVCVLHTQFPYLRVGVEGAE